MRAFALACGCVVLAFFCVTMAGTIFGDSIIGPLWGLAALVLFVTAAWLLIRELIRTLKGLWNQNLRLK